MLRLLLSLTIAPNLWAGVGLVRGGFGEGVMPILRRRGLWAPDGVAGLAPAAASDARQGAR